MVPGPGSTSPKSALPLLDDTGQAAARSYLVDARVPPIMSFPGLFRAREIWIDGALCRAARCRRVALRQRRVAAFVIVEPRPSVHVQTNRVSRIVHLGRRRPY